MVLLSIGLLLIICYLIYLEIIQLNFCNLNKNTTVNIEKRMIEGLKSEISFDSESELPNGILD